MICNRCNKVIMDQHDFESVDVDGSYSWCFHIECYVEYLQDKVIINMVPQRTLNPEGRTA